jgi:carbon-monoxide dehydrogenase large subunit
MGQGIRTSLAQVCADTLGVKVVDVDVIAADTAFESLGQGGYASRQAVTAGSSVFLASQAVRAKAFKVAAQILKAEEAELAIEDGWIYVVAGVPERGVSLAEVAERLRGQPGYPFPEGVDAGLQASSYFRTDGLAYANAFHVCEVEVDTGTGGVRILRYVALQDSGRLINPLIVEGQIHGSVVHGIGNALFEHMRYDESGQPVTVTFADYLLPTAPELPNIEILFHETPSPLNPLGVKGAGEVGLIPVTSAVISAIEHALAPFGVKIYESPLSPVRIVELIRNAHR